VRAVRGDPGRIKIGVLQFHLTDVAHVMADVERAEADDACSVRLDEVAAIIIDHVPVDAVRMLVDVVGQ
jgi:hypothetical protein